MTTKELNDIEQGCLAIMADASLRKQHGAAERLLAASANLRAKLVVSEAKSAARAARSDK